VPTLVHLQNGNDLVVWQPPTIAGKHYYRAVEIRPEGGPAASPRNVFGSQYWGGLGAVPDLLPDNGTALLVFDGSRGDTNPKDPYNDACIVGALLTPGGWKLQTWSLSSDCVQTDHFGAAITRSGVVAAAFAFGGIHYRIGVALDSRLAAGPPDPVSQL